MVKLLARRLAISIALIVIIPALTFVLEALTPGNASAFSVLIDTIRA